MKKIIITTVAVAIILCLGIATLVMSLIPVNMNDKVAVPDDIYIYCSQTNSLAKKRIELRHRDGETDINKINKIYDLFDSAFQQKALNALFKGELNYSTTSDHTEVSKSISKNFSSEDKITIVFYFKDQEVVKYEDKEYKYNYLFFEISGEDSRQEVVMGVNTSIPSDESNYPVENISYYYSYKSKANFAELYKYVSELVSID
ncbi:MAG: hypothetical protein IJW32_00390 [Clostridia bacterium]|nr:hypothetical protein [Clostridia bacterium]